MGRLSGRYGRLRRTMEPLLLGFIFGILLSLSLRMLSSPCRGIATTAISNEPFSFSGDEKIDNNDVAGSDLSSGSSLEDQNPCPRCNISGPSKVSDFDSDQSQPSFSSPGAEKVGGKSQAVAKKRRLLFVGVMTAEKYLNNRVLGVFETWAQQVPGRVVFFTGANASKITTDYGKLSQNFTLVALDGVDDTYPPQRKSFMMLKYMYDNFGEDYEWFMRADDDVYVKVEKLSELLRSIDSRQLHFIGQAGKGNRAEKGSLNLAHNENFCMGGPGIILSRKALAKVAPYVQNCLESMFSTHEDVELGRCVRRFAGVSCTWAYEMQSIFYHNSSGDVAFSDNLKRPEVHRAITLHPVKDYRLMYRLHSYVQSLRVQELLYELLLTQRRLLALNSSESSVLSNKLSGKVKIAEAAADGLDDVDDLHIYGLPPSLNKYTPTNESDVLSWNFFSRGLYSSENTNPKQKFDGAMISAMNDVIRDFMDLLNGFSRDRGRIIEFKEVLYGYTRVNPLFGEDLILDLLLTYKKYRGRKMTVPVRRHVYIQRPFAPLQLNLLVPDVLKGPTSQSRARSSARNRPSKLVMILPLYGRNEAFTRFLSNFKQACIEWESRDKAFETHLELNLKIVFFEPEEEAESNRNQFFSIINSFRSTNVHNIQSCQIQVVQVDGAFSRAIALETGVSQCGDNDLLFFIDVDILFTPTALDHVRLNTVQGRQVYFPIVFSEFDPKFYQAQSPSASINHNTINEDRGYWRNYGFGIAAFYKLDFYSAGGFDTSIKGWGKEDVSLYESFISSTNLTIFRAPDPHLIHIYHDIVCDADLSPSQYEMCLGTRANTLGSYQTLIKYYFTHGASGSANKIKTAYSR